MNLDPFRDLHQPRLPLDVAALGWPEVLAGFGLGLLLALGIFELLRPAFTRKARPDLEAELVRLKSLPAAERLLAEARLLDRLGAPLPDEARAQLYAPEATAPDLEPLIRRAWRAKGGAHV